MKLKKKTIDLCKKIFRGLKPPPKRTITEWANKFRRLSPEASAEPGRWKTSKAPYQAEIMNAIGDLEVQKVVVMSAAQIGKSDACILNPLGYFMHYDPCPIMIMQPTIQMAETFSKDRVSTMIRDTPVLANKVNEKTRNSGNTILQKVFPGGHCTLVGANSPSSLASRPIRILLADEIDRYPPTAGNEGDPLLLADKRLTTFWNRKTVCVSTPTVKGLSRIEIEFEHSTQEHWYVPCPHCGQYTELVWSGVVFNKTDLEKGISYECPHCGVVEREYVWKEGYINGKFIAKHPNRSVRGFHLNSLASLFVSWTEIVEKFLTANEKAKQGNVELLKTWTNLEMGQTWEEEGVSVESDDLIDRLEDYDAEVPAEVIVLTCGVDVQDDRFELEVVGWGEEKESYGIYYKKIYGDLKGQNIWKELDEYLSRTFETADGRRLKIVSTCIDSGGHFTQEVYKFCKTRVARRIWAIKGKGGSHVAYYSKPSISNAYKTPLFSIGVDTGKAILYQRLAVRTAGANFCHFPRGDGRGYNEAYFKGLTSETMVLTYKKGRAEYVWKLKEGIKRNEPLDVRNYATAALEIANPLLKPEAQDMSVAPVTRKARRTRTRGI